ncbi:MAG: hypothetical protein Q4E73_07420 [Lachnospiraceae bacterium]|nr:hypothetical protein [Lachnospiraceae bacterium]
MRVPFHILFGCFFLFFMTFVMISCNAVAYQTKTAWNQYDTAVKEIENSHFEPEIIEKMIQDSGSRGYQMTVLEDCVYEDVQRYQVKLSYKIKVPVFQVERKREISGYAI